MPLKEDIEKKISARPNKMPKSSIALKETQAHRGSPAARRVRGLPALEHPTEQEAASIC